MKRKLTVSLLCLSLLACAKVGNNPAIAAEPTNYKLAINSGASSSQVKFVPVAVPGQLMSLKKDGKHQKLVGEEAIDTANKKAIREPNSGEYVNSIMNFDYMPGALYQIYCAPLSVTDVQFQPSEHIISVGAGDTLRWQVSKTFSGSGVMRQEHLLIKPVDSDITNSLVVTTDQRTYHLMLHATTKTYMASVAWRYPDGDGLMTNIGEDGQTVGDDTDITSTIDISRLNFNYTVTTIKGHKPEWFPKMVFSDGTKTYIKFPNTMQEAPTLFVGEGSDANKITQLVNYRVIGNYYVVDSVIKHAQLRSGPEDGLSVVQISHKN